MFDRKPHKIMNAQAICFVMVGIIAGIMARRFFWERFNFDPLAPSLDQGVSSADVAALMVGSLGFGLVGGLFGLGLGYFMGRKMQFPPMVATLTVVLAAIITIKYHWAWRATALFLIGYVLFWVELIALFFVGQAKAKGQIVDETASDEPGAGGA